MSSEGWYALRVPKSGYSTILTSPAEINEALKKFTTVEIEWCQSFEEACAWLDRHSPKRKSGSREGPGELEQPHPARIRANGPRLDPLLPLPSKAFKYSQTSDTSNMGASSSSMQIPGDFPTSPRHHEDDEYEYDIGETDLSNVDLDNDQLDIAPPSTQTTVPSEISSPVKGPASDGSSTYSYSSNDFPDEEPDYDISPPTTSQFGSSQPSKSTAESSLRSTVVSQPDPPPASTPILPGDGDIELSPEQKHVLDLVLQGKSVFFTGSAGTGKSVLLRRIIKTLSDRRTEGVVVTASTGIAAVNIQGQTLHAFAGVGLGNQKRSALISRAWKSPGVPQRWREARILIIDEISMVAARWFDDLEAIARSVRENEKPFGGIQLVVCGDFFQLPPVPDYNEGATGLYTEFAFRAQSWKRALPTMITLTEVFRQKQPELINMLNDMRVGRISEETARLFRSLSRPVVYPDGIRPTEILPLRRQVQASNQVQLDQLPGKLVAFDAQDAFFRDSEGNPIRPAYGKTLLDRFISYTVQLKVGAQVMCVKNMRESGLVNGSVGKIIAFQTPWEVRNGWSAPCTDDEDDTTPIESVPQVEKQDQAETKAPVQNAQMIPCHENIKAPAEGRESVSPKWPTSSNPKQCDSVQPTPDRPHKINLRYYTRIASDLEPDPNDRKYHGPDTQHAYESSRWPLVQYTTGARVLMGPVKFTHEGPEAEVQAERLQIPLIPAWALTVHKSQGQTLERVKVDLAGTFEKGQAYVALSRCTSLGGLEVLNFKPHVVMAHPSVVVWSRSLSFYQPPGSSPTRPYQQASSSLALATPLRPQRHPDEPDTDEEEIAIEMYHNL
ncbi:hypothetical protein RSOLAG22IIIB_11134 [Rhizoctonia solani]|uniref:ATP-dependent DNA helicase PIF1 n=1 Tax=Rhizoctonia solani TaxID=456999 RepID=A0A0K6G747_9AGAM|nr:hypothetical protein RSOLAG22IIIB_11134 [Rhizoctonia solani]